MGTEDPASTTHHVPAEAGAGGGGRRLANKIMVAVDLSGASDKALRFACEKLVHEGDELVVVHLIQTEVDLSDYFYSGLDISPEQLKAELKGEAQYKADGILRIAQAVCREAGVHGIKIRVHVERSFGKDMLCNLADMEKVDMLVVGSHGRTGITKVLLGSVSNYVVNHCKVPVVVVRQT